MRPSSPASQSSEVFHSCLKRTNLALDLLVFCFGMMQMPWKTASPGSTYSNWYGRIQLLQGNPVFQGPLSGFCFKAYWDYFTAGLSRGLNSPAFTASHQFTICNSTFNDLTSCIYWTFCHCIMLGCFFFPKKQLAGNNASQTYCLSSC